MKKAPATDHRADPKSLPTARTVEEYLDRVPEPARTTLDRIRAVIRSAVPPETTEAISYRIPTFQCNGPLIGFAAFPHHCSLYPMSTHVMETFQSELRNYQTSKGAIRFALDKPLPSALVKKLVKARLLENAHRKDR